jgi:nucleoside-triphosphatase THEP1
MSDRTHETADAGASRTGRAPVVIITGERGAGKTTLAAAVVELLRATDVRVGGVLAPGTYRDGRRYSFDVVAVATGERRPLSCRDPKDGWVEERCFWADPEALALGNAALCADDADVVVVDEVGPWELAGSGWAARLGALVRAPAALLLVVRHACLFDVVSRWELEPTAVVEADGADPGGIAELLRGR